MCSTVKAHKILLGKSEGIRSLRLPGAGEELLLKWFLLGVSNSGYDLVAGPLEHRNGPLASVKWGEFLD